MDLKTRSHWLLGYGLARATLKLLARRGDPFAQLVIDNNQPDNAHHLIEQIRDRGRMSPVIGGWATADAQIVREVLRDDRFRTAKPHDRSPFRIAARALAKTNPGVLNGLEPPSLLVIDPPEHERLRRLVSRAFTPRAIDRLRHRIQEIANALLDDLDGQSRSLGTHRRATGALRALPPTHPCGRTDPERQHPIARNQVPSHRSRTGQSQCRLARVSSFPDSRHINRVFAGQKSNQL